MMNSIENNFDKNGEPTLVWRAKCILLFVALVVFFAALESRIVLNGTASVDAKILFTQPGAAISKGDYVLAPMSTSQYLPIGFDTLTKHALCVGGDRLKFSDEHFYCNGVQMNKTKKRTRAGRTLPVFDWKDGVIPDGMVFIGSSHPDGFDSRYIGLFDRDELIKLKAIL